MKFESKSIYKKEKEAVDDKKMIKKQESNFSYKPDNNKKYRIEYDEILNMKVII